MSSDTTEGKINEFKKTFSRGALSSFQLLIQIWEKELGKVFKENHPVTVNIFERKHFPFSSSKIKD